MEIIPVPGAESSLPRKRRSCSTGLRSKCAWQQSRREYKPLAGIPELLSLRSRVEEITPAVAYSNLGLPRLGYNAVLCNLYQNGNDSVGLHADTELEMEPVIAAVSLGAERLFCLKGRS